jgi:hypothetical protein
MVSYETASSLSKKGVMAIGCIAGGLGLFILGSLSTVAGIVTGAVAAVVGICALSSKDPSDKTPGFIIAGAGALTIVSKLPLLGFLAKPVLGFGAVVLLGVGIWNGIKFFKGLKARSGGRY